jgi:hypothetical protein
VQVFPNLHRRARDGYLGGMPADKNRPLETIDLAGDGDEVDAIAAVETHFGIFLDHADAPAWVTAGDLFGSLLKALPPDQGEREDLWPQFTRILCDETGADPTRVGPDTLLLGLPLRTVAGRWLSRLFGWSD